MRRNNLWRVPLTQHYFIKKNYPCFDTAFFMTNTHREINKNGYDDFKYDHGSYFSYLLNICARGDYLTLIILG